MNALLPLLPRMILSPSLLIHGIVCDSRAVLADTIIGEIVRSSAELVILDTADSLDRFRGVSGLSEFADGKTLITRVLADTAALADERLQRMAEAGERTCSDPHRYVIIDDLMEVMEYEEEKRRNDLRRILLRARQTNIHVVAFSFYSDEELEMESHFADFLFMEGADEDTVRRFLPDFDMDSLENEKCLAIIGGEISLVELKTDQDEAEAAENSEETESISEIEPTETIAPSVAPRDREETAPPDPDGSLPVSQKEKAEQILRESRQREGRIGLILLLVSLGIGVILLPLLLFAPDMALFFLFCDGSLFVVAVVLLSNGFKGASPKPRLSASVSTELQKADSLDGHAFEHYVARLLPAMGFTNITVTQGSGDYGVDVIAYDGAVKIAIQCKLYTSPVGVKAVQEVYAGKAHYHADLAAVITNNYFTEAARTLADETGVELWDRDTLAGLILEAIRKQEAETANSTQTK